MTFEEMCKNYCTSNGMAAESAEEVIKELKISELIPEYLANKFNSPTSDYPDSVKAIVMMGLKDVAVSWIDKNQPQAWYRPLFVGGVV